MRLLRHKFRGFNKDSWLPLLQRKKGTERERKRERKDDCVVYGHGFAKTASGRRFLRSCLIGVEFSSKEIDVCVMKIFLPLFVSCVSVFARLARANLSNFKFHGLDELSDNCNNSWPEKFVRDKPAMHTVCFYPRRMYIAAPMTVDKHWFVSRAWAGMSELHITTTTKEASNDF